VRPGVESPEFRLAVRVMVQRREVALELNEELGFALTEFRSPAHMCDGPVGVGKHLRDALGVPIEEQLAWRDEW
jgi:hypothetical protein